MEKIVNGGPHLPGAQGCGRGVGRLGTRVYDFFIYATAASLVFPQLFFPSSDSAVAIAASLATYGVGYIARPVGAFVGDGAPSRRATRCGRAGPATRPAPSWWS